MAQAIGTGVQTKLTSKIVGVAHLSDALESPEDFLITET